MKCRDLRELENLCVSHACLKILVTPPRASLTIKFQRTYFILWMKRNLKIRFTKNKIWMFHETVLDPKSSIFNQNHGSVIGSRTFSTYPPRAAQLPRTLLLCIVSKVSTSTVQFVPYFLVVIHHSTEYTILFYCRTDTNETGLVSHHHHAIGNRAYE